VEERSMDLNEKKKRERKEKRSRIEGKDQEGPDKNGNEKSSCSSSQRSQISKIRSIGGKGFAERPCSRPSRNRGGPNGKTGFVTGRGGRGVE